jgi:hypothetical protein
MSDINSEIGNLTSAIEHLENTLRQSIVHSTPKPDTQVSTQMAMNNNPSSKRAGVVFFALRLSYRLSDLIARMGSFLQLIPDFHFPLFFLIYLLC